MIYVSLTIALAAGGWASKTIKAHQRHEPVDFIMNDAEGYYIYLPALLIHHDLDFRKEILHHQYASHLADTKSFLRRDGSSMNRWPIGVALTVSPAFLLAHAVSTLVYAHTLDLTYLPDGYTIIYQAFCATFAMALGLVAMLCADDIIKARGISDRCTVAGILTYVLATNFVYYFAREPLMSHLPGAAWLLVAIWCTDRIVRCGESLKTYGMLGAFAAAMALVCRMTNVVDAPIAIFLLMSLWKQGRMREIVPALPRLAIALLPLLAQAAIWHALNGHAVAANVQTIGYRPNEGFHWLHPQWWRILISSRHGLFFWSPLLLFSFWGLIIGLRRRRDGLVTAWVISALLLYYLNAAWVYWSFGNSFGAREFVELGGLFMIGTAMLYEWLGQKGWTTRCVVCGLMLLCFGYNWIMMALYISQRIPRDGYLW